MIVNVLKSECKKCGRLKLQHSLKLCKLYQSAILTRKQGNCIMRACVLPPHKGGCIWITVGGGVHMSKVVEIGVCRSEV